jgi:putative salt-induced outer membrane protein
VRFLPVLAAAPLLLANAEPAAMPIPVRTMLEAAIASGNENEVLTVAKYACQAAPEATAAINGLVDAWHRKRAEQHQRELREAGPFELWHGRVELGGFLTTGNTGDTGAHGVIDLTRETERWRNKIHLAADYEESAGVVSRDHFLASYEPNFKFTPRAYVYGSAQFESDHFLGFDQRYSASVGAGYSAIKQPRITLDLELGPAYRYTSFTDDTLENSVAARGSLNFGWKLTKAMSVSQIASAYLEHYNSTVSSTTAFNAKLIGPLAASLSYAVQYESLPPVGGVRTDTTSRASLIYSF